MTLSHEEFLRRFEQHILPRRFVKIRHSGFLSHQNKSQRLAKICEQLQITAPPPKVELPVTVLAAMKYGVDIMQCSICKIGRMQLIESFVNTSRHGINLVNVKNLARGRASPKIKNPIY